MLLSQPPGITDQLRLGDWHADSRLMYLAPNDMAARGDIKEVPGNSWRMHSELARTTQITVRPVAPSPQDMLRVTNPDCQDDGTDKRVHKEDKAAQRGPSVASAYLTAALTKASVSSSETLQVNDAWVQPGEETWVIDVFHGWVIAQWQPWG